PGGLGWKAIAEKVGTIKSNMDFGKALVNWIFGVILVYSFLFGLGSFLFSFNTSTILYLIVGVISAIVIYRNLKAI
ncbi:MAG: sodium:proline symporter, partial [Ignavibacteriae bacterium]|nr:sodium:proline symporter [Ignavibacteriota bacterium]